MKTEAPAEQENKKQIIEFVPYGTKDKISLTIELVKRLVAVKTKSGKTCTDEDAFKFMLMCQARRLNPFEGDAYLIGYDGQHGATFSLITAHQAFLKRAELHPEFDGMESGTIVQRGSDLIDLVGDWHMPNDKVVGGWATVYFKNRKHPMKKRLRLDRFNKNYGIWKDDPAGMIVKCAEADALRSSFPTMLGGMYITEEIEPPSAADIARPVFPEATTNGPVKAEVVEAEPAPAPRTPEPEAKKKPTLARREKSPTSHGTEKGPREKFADLLAVGSCTPDDFVSLAIDEGWIESGTPYTAIPEEKFAEFTREENWAFIMSLLDERRAVRTGAAK